MAGQIVAVARDGEHRFAKRLCDSIRLLAGVGVDRDAHAGPTVQHLSHKAKAPEKPNLRQVHLIHAELFEELMAKGFEVAPGQLGENVTTRGIDLLGLSRGTRLLLGSEAVIEVTGLRNPCAQIDANIGSGGMAATLDRAPDGSLVRKAGVMAIVIAGGTVRPGDAIAVLSSPREQRALEPV